MSLHLQVPFLRRYYVLRDDMLGYYVNDIAERLAAKHEDQGWEVSLFLNPWQTHPV
jgi:hypothetical protein